MIQEIVIDTGPLIAYLNPKDTHHAWAIEGSSSFGAGALGGS